MANEKIVIGATITTDSKPAQESVKSYRTQLREAREDLLKLQTQYGEFSKEAVAAAKKVAELNDTMGDSQSLVDAFNPDRKFQALGQSVQGVVGGFTALQGVMGLLGSESEETQKLLLKVQGALAISQGLDDIREAQQGFKNLGAVISQSTLFIKANEMANKAAAFSMKLFGVSVETTSTSFKVLKGAIAATGIGLLLVLVGEAVSLFNEMSSAAERAAEAQKKAFAAADKGNDADLQGRLDFINRTEKLDESRLKRAGATEEAITANKISAIRRRIFALEDLSKEEGISEEKRNARLEALKEERVNLEIAENDAVGALRAKKLAAQKKANDKEISEEQRRREALRKEAEELNRQLGNENDVNAAGGGMGSELVKLQQEYDAKAAVLKAGGISLLELDQWYFDARGAIADKYRQEQDAKDIEANNARMARESAEATRNAQQVDENYQKRLGAFTQLAQMEEMTAQSKREFLDSVEKQILADVTMTDAQRTATMAASANARKQIDEAEYQSKLATVQSIGNLMGQLSNIIGQQTKAGKALALAQIAIDTAVAISGIVRQVSSNPLNLTPVNFALDLAARSTIVLANIMKARNMLKSADTSASTSLPAISTSAPGVNTAAPLRPNLATTQTQLNANSINELSNRAIRTFVTEKDGSSNQERVREINRRARLGP